ncbi:MAG TPA: hypothetical protein VKR53_17865 [Puia sp.]|nr:hypothetical protein [Puia sp.]
MKKFLTYTILIIVAGLLIFFLARYYYVFGEGVKAGQLNYVVKKGYIFKTYEGKLIQSGFRASTPGAVQSYEFEFSIENKRIADTLMVNSGKEVELHYKEYLGSVPWRGYSEFIVDSVISIHDVK